MKYSLVLTNRASYARSFTFIDEMFKQMSDIDELDIVVHGSAEFKKYGAIADEIRKDFCVEPYVMRTLVEGGDHVSMVKTTGLALLELADYFEREDVGCAITIADRHETLATAIAASYMNIFLVHMQGGEITGSIDNKVRFSISALADLHLTCTESATILLKENHFRGQVVQTGCPSIDLVARHTYEPPQFERYGGLGGTFGSDEPYILMVFHPDTLNEFTQDQQTAYLLDECLDTGLNVIVLWPNVDAGSNRIEKVYRDFREFEDQQRVRFFRHLEKEDYLDVMQHADLLVGNSSSFIREASYLGVPAVVVGGRQAGRECAENVRRVPFKGSEIHDAINAQLKHGFYNRSYLYGNGNSGEKAARAVLRKD